MAEGNLPEKDLTLYSNSSNLALRVAVFKNPRLNRGVRLKMAGDSRIMDSTRSGLYDFPMERTGERFPIELCFIYPGIFSQPSGLAWEYPAGNTALANEVRNWRLTNRGGAEFYLGEGISDESGKKDSSTKRGYQLGKNASGTDGKELRKKTGQFFREF